jgi:hypothetical protein
MPSVRRAIPAYKELPDKRAQTNAPFLIACPIWRLPQLPLTMTSLLPSASSGHQEFSTRFPPCLASTPQSRVPRCHLKSTQPRSPQLSPVSSPIGVALSTFHRTEVCARLLKPPPPQFFARALSSAKAPSLAFPLLPSLRFGCRSSEFSTGKHAAPLHCFSVWQHATMASVSVFPPPHAGPTTPPRCGGAHVDHLGEVPPPLARQNEPPTSTTYSLWPSLGASPSARQHRSGRRQPRRLCYHGRARARAGH